MAGTVSPGSDSGAILREFLRGYGAGLSGMLVGYPLDTVKVQMQWGRSKSLRSALSTIVHSPRGALALWDGIAAPITSYGVLVAINFAIFTLLSDYLMRVYHPAEGSPKHFGILAVSGFASGSALSVASCPFEVLKVRMQSTAGQTGCPRRKYPTNTWRLARQIVATEGVSSLVKTRALCANFCMMSVGSSVYFSTFAFATYEAKRWKGSELSLPERIGLGGLTGVFYWCSIFGLDTIKTRVLVDCLNPTPTYRGVVHCAREIYRQGGIRPFYCGLSAAIFRGFPVNAVMLSVYSYLGDLEKKHM